MITLTAKISLIDGNASNSVSKAELRRGGKNNVSSDLTAVIGQRKKANAFIIGSSKVGDFDVYTDRADYFIGNSLSYQDPSSGLIRFPEPYNISISGTDKAPILMEFDTKHKRYPTKILFVDASASRAKMIEGKWYIELLEGSGSFNIEFYNEANCPLVITAIYALSTITIDNRNLVDFNRSIFERSDIKFPSYGIISNTGNIRFSDLNDEVRVLALNRGIYQDMETVISVKNTLNGATQQIGKFETREWDYDNINRIVSVSLKDDLEEWQDIPIEALNYNPNKPNEILSNGTMAELYQWLHARTPAKYAMKSFDELDKDTRAILSDTKMRHPMLKASNLWHQWQKLCGACALYIYKNNSGETTCSYAYGS